MGQTMSSKDYNALTSHGYPSTLKPELTQKYQVLSEKAKQAFPPPFVNKPQDPEAVETPEGNRALELGSAAMKRAKAQWRTKPPTKEEVVTELGDLECFLLMFGLHYCRMFSDPRMNVLFDTRHADTNVSALDHGKRVGAAVLDRWYGTRYFRSLGRGSSFFAVTPTHQQAKRCPMRPVHHQKAMKFTTKQRDTWIGHVTCAAGEMGASQEFQDKLSTALAGNIDIYAPFLQED
eukprot:m.332527 g.332527  ORF g.332527 m.332527 type:complete len:234 (-) comp16957_c0_seq1:691-1392(-)